MLQEEGEQIGRFKVRSLMRELALVSKQPGSHAYKKATVERPDIPNILNRAFDVEAPNQVWCGDITYVWAQGKWHYLAVVLDLYARRVVGWALSEKPNADLVVKALEVAYEQRGKPQGLLFHPGQLNPPNMAVVSSARDCGATACARASAAEATAGIMRRWSEYFAA